MKKLFENTVWWVGVLCLGIVVGVTIKIVGAWVEPNQMPPGGNIAAPLNTGNVGQSKTGGLTLNIGGATYGLIVDKGLVGIKTTTPQAELDVNGDIRAHNLNLNGNLNVSGTINGNNVNGGGGCKVDWVGIHSGGIVNGNHVYWNDGKDHSPSKMCQDAGFQFPTGLCKSSFNGVQIEGSIVSNTETYKPNWAASCEYGSSAFYMGNDPDTNKILCMSCSSGGGSGSFGERISDIDNSKSNTAPSDGILVMDGTHLCFYITINGEQYGYNEQAANYANGLVSSIPLKKGDVYSFQTCWSGGAFPRLHFIPLN